MEHRTLDDVEEEFRDEQHLPMLRLVRRLKAFDWSDVVWDVSMLRLWVARSNATRPEVIVTLAEQRYGGKPLDQDCNEFEIAILNPPGILPTISKTAEEAVEALRSWYSGEPRS